MQNNGMAMREEGIGTCFLNHAYKEAVPMLAFYYCGQEDILFFLSFCTLFFLYTIHGLEPADHHRDNTASTPVRCSGCFEMESIMSLCIPCSIAPE